VRIEVDGRLHWTVSQEAVAREGLEVGLVPDGQTIERLECAADEEAALRTGLRALSRRPFARRDLARRLGRKGHPREAVDGALGELERMGLIDDLAFAEQYVEAKVQRGQGPRRLLHDLRGLGLEPEVAQEAIARTFPPDRDLGPMVEHLASKRAAQLGSLPPVVKRRRLLAYLTRRGFGGSEVIDAVNGAMGNATAVDRG